MRQSSTHPAPATPSDPPRPKGPQPEFLRVDQVARILVLSQKRVYQMIRERQLDAIRLGPRGIRVDARSVETFIRARFLEAGDQRS